MADDQPNPQPQGANLAGLDELDFNSKEFLSRLAEVLGQPEDVGLLQQLSYLLLRWASLTIYILAPSAEFKAPPKFIRLPNCLTIYDYNDRLIITRGEEFAEGAQATGKFIDTVKAMIRTLRQRGITEIAFSGHPLGKSAAWLEAVAQNDNLKVVNYQPTVKDLEIRLRLQQQTEATQPTLQRPEPT